MPRPTRSRRSTRKAVFRPSWRGYYLRRLRRRPPLPGPSSEPGVPVLGDVGFPAARLLVEVAFGADLTASEDLYDWTDVTADVQVADGAAVNMRKGRSNEADRAQPAHLAVRLDNRTGRYSLGPQALHWPNVRRNTPVRVQFDPDGAGTGYVTRFVGFADAWQPRWDESGRSAWVELSASGILRRISQGQQPVISALRRTMSEQDDVRAYWPCEDGRDAPAFASAFAGHPAMTIIGAPVLATNNDFDCSLPLPVIKDGAFRGVVPTYSGTTEAQVRFLMSVPDGGYDTDFILLSVFTSGSICRVDMVYRTGFGGGLQAKAYADDGSEVLSTLFYTFGVDGATARYGLLVYEVGADVYVTMQRLGVGFTTGSTTDDIITGESFSRITAVTINPDRETPDFAIGHISVEDDATSQFAEEAEFNGHNGEYGRNRFVRLSEENGLPWQIIDNSVTGDLHFPGMGPQRVAPLLELFREVEDVDGGILHDGSWFGATLRLIRAIENRDADFTLDAAAGDISPTFEPLDDDQHNRNKVTVSRTNGQSVTIEDTDGPLGTDTIGDYDTAETLTLTRDSDSGDAASWRVHLGTQDGYRYPTLDLDFTRSPELADGWLAARIGDRIDLQNVDQVREQHPAGDLRLLLVGYSEEITAHTWRATLNLAPGLPYRVGVLAEATGDTGEYVIRAEGDGSTLQASVTSGASSLSVLTPDGPLWTTDTDDFPLTISVQGIVVEVTAVSGSSSPQTFTVTPATVTRNLSAGQPIELAEPARLGL